MKKSKTSDASPSPRLSSSGTSGVLFRAVKLIPVAVVSSGDGIDDSVTTIIQRDLVYGDKIRSVVVTAADFSPDQTGFSSLKSADFAVRIMRADGGVSVELYDVASRTVVQSKHFVIPFIPTGREVYLHDSIAYVLAMKAIETKMELVRNQSLRESAYALLTAPRPKLKKKAAIETWIRDSTVRAAYFDSLTQAATTIMVAAREDTASAAAVIPALLTRESVMRDSLQQEVRWALHGIADEVHLWITGERGIAQSRIAYVQDGQLRIVDFDGANDRAVTNGGKALSPAWHPDGHSLVFTDMNEHGTQIAELHLLSGQVRHFNATPRGLNITPVYTRDGRNVIYAHTNTGFNTDLILMDVTDSTAAPFKIAPSGYDNLSPTLNPEGTRIAFMSSRPRTPQIYSMKLDGTDEKLETPLPSGVRSYRAGPDWSPDGRTIVYEQQNGDFQVWAIDIASKRIRQLTNVGENEDPTWAPNARHIALTSTRGGTKVLWILDTDSGRFRQLTRIPGGRLAAWSPMLTKSVVVARGTN